MRVLRSKRGVSPLIATILLIAFAVALGAVVMQFGAGLEAGGCGADLQVIVENACIDGKGTSGTVDVDLKNIGAIDVVEVELWVHGDKDGIKTKKLVQPLKKFTNGKYSTEFDFLTYGKVKRVEVIPYIDDGGPLQCEQNKVVAKRLVKC